MTATAANVSDVSQTHALQHGDETEVLGDAGYQGVEKRAENRAGLRRRRGFVATPQGENIVRRAWSALVVLEGPLIDCLSDERRKSLTAALVRLGHEA